MIPPVSLPLTGGTVSILGGRDKERTTVTAGAGDGAIALPVVVLVSSGTAGAAEVFAAALAGNHRADLVGAHTAGLAGVQRLGDGGFLSGWSGRQKVPRRGPRWARRSHRWSACPGGA